MAKRESWSPFKGSQTLALRCPADEVLLTGSRGSGKTEAQIMRFAMHCGRGFGAHWRGVIIDREYKALDDIIGKSKRLMRMAHPEARFYASKSDYKWVWPTGEELLFRHGSSVDDYNNQFHGQSFPFVGLNELTNYIDDKFYTMIQSCIRTAYQPRKGESRLPMVQFSTTNPSGRGAPWVKKRFIDQQKARKIRSIDMELEDGSTVSKTRCYIHSNYQENTFLDKRYVAQLESYTDPVLRAAWIKGDWSVQEGGAINDVYDDRVHKVPRFQIPASWELIRGFDNGSTQPYAVAFAALANGEEVKMLDGSTFCPQPNSIILTNFLYGGEKDHTGRVLYESNKGDKTSIRDVAKAINAMSQQMQDEQWTSSPHYYGVSDNAIFNTNDTEWGSLASVMESEGITWNRSDKSAGSRVRGLQLIRQMLQNAIDGEGPALYVMEHVEPFFETVVNIPRCTKKPEDVDTTAVDHFWDALRYLCTAKVNTPSQSLEVSFDW